MNKNEKDMRETEFRLPISLSLSHNTKETRKTTRNTLENEKWVNNPLTNVPFCSFPLD